MFGRAQWHGHQETLLLGEWICESTLAICDAILEKVYIFPGNFTSVD